MRQVFYDSNGKSKGSDDTGSVNNRAKMLQKGKKKHKKAPPPRPSKPPMPPQPPMGPSPMGPPDGGGAAPPAGPSVFMDAAPPSPGSQNSYHYDGMKPTMEEFKAGNLHSGSPNGPKVNNRKQAIAIGLSEERKMGKKV